MADLIGDEDDLELEEILTQGAVALALGEEESPIPATVRTNDDETLVHPPSLTPDPLAIHDDNPTNGQGIEEQLRDLAEAVRTGAIAPEEAAFFAQGFGADIGALVQTQSTASGSSQSAQRRVYRAKGLLQQELEDRKSMLSEQQREAITVAFGRLIDNWDVYKRRDSQLMEDLMDAAGDVRQELLLTVEAVGEEIIQRIAAKTMHPLMNEQCQQSREQGLDGLTEFPAPSVQRDLMLLGFGTRAYDLTNGFLQNREVPLRRMAQLARQEFFSLVTLRFGSGGIEQERQYVEDNYFTNFTRTGWIVARAIQAMWHGERNIQVLTPMVDDHRSLIVVKAVLSLIVIMERRLLLREVPELEVLVNTLLDLKQQAGERFNEAVATLTTIVTRAQRSGGTRVRQTPETVDRLLNYPAGGACLHALGFVFDGDNTWTLSNTPSHAQDTLKILHDITREAESSLEWVPLSRNLAWSSPGHDCSFNVVQPGQHDTVYMGAQCTVTWLKNPTSDVDMVDINLVRGDFEDLVERNGSMYPRTLKPVRILAGGVANTGQYVFNMPDDFLEGEYFKITVNATLNKSDADQSLPFDIRRPAPRTAPSDDDVKMKDPDTYSSPKEYARALAEYLTKHGPGTALVLRKAKSSLSEGTSAIFVRLHDNNVDALVNASELEVMVALEDLGLPRERQHPVPVATVDESAAVKVEESRRSKQGGGEKREAGQVWPTADLQPTDCNRHRKGHHVFVSYRRKDGEQYAGRIAFYLQSLGYEVFFDRDCLGPFSRFDESLIRNIYNAGAFVMVMTPEYLNIDRLNNPNDWCRKELEAAVESDRVIIPLKCGDMEPFPVYQQLNSERVRLRLANLNVVGVQAQFFREVMDMIHVELQKSPMMPHFTPPVLTKKDDRGLSLQIDCTESDTLFSGSPIKMTFEVAGEVERVCIELVNADRDEVVKTLELAYLCSNGTNVYEWRITSRTPGGRYAIHIAAYDMKALYDRSSCFVVSGEPVQQPEQPPAAQPPVQSSSSASLQPPVMGLAQVRRQYSPSSGHGHVHSRPPTTPPPSTPSLPSPTTPFVPVHVPVELIEIDVSNVKCLEQYDEDSDDILLNFQLPPTATLAELRVLLCQEVPSLSFKFRRSRCLSGGKIIYGSVAEVNEASQRVDTFRSLDNPENLSFFISISICRDQ